MTTAVGNNIAIPHAKSEGIDWGAPKGDLAQTIFLISVPEAQAGNEHLRILAKLSRALARPAFREALHGAATPAEVLAVLQEKVT